MGEHDISVIRFKSHNEEETRYFSYQLGLLLQHPCCIALDGDLGAGKTCFVQGLASGLGVKDEVLSPTFSIIHEHAGRLDLLHADLYRIEEDDLCNLGLEETFELFQGVVVVEWARKFPQLLPQDHINIRIEVDIRHRQFYLQASGSKHEPLLAALQQRDLRG